MPSYAEKRRVKAGVRSRRTWLAPTFLIGLFVIVWGLLYAPWDDPAAPAWVQAIGSVLAIFTAVGISFWQRLEVKRAERDAAFEYMRRAHMEFRGMSGCILSVKILDFGGAIPAQFLPGVISSLKANLEPLRMFNPIQIVDDEYASCWQSLLMGVRHFIEDLELDLAGENEAARHDVTDHIKILEYRAKWLDDAFKQVLVEYGEAR